SIGQGGGAGTPPAPRLDPSGLRTHSDHFVALGIDTYSVNMFPLQVLDQRHAGSLVLDHKFASVAGVTPFAVHLDDLALEIRIVKTITDHFQHVGCFALNLEHNAG